MASSFYNRGLGELMTAAMGSADIRVLLVTTAYTFNKDHDYVSDVSSNELTVTGYARQSLAGLAATIDDTNDWATLDANDVSFGVLAAGQTIGGAVIFRHTGTDGTAPLIAFIDVSNFATAGTIYNIQWNAVGILKLVHA